MSPPPADLLDAMSRNFGPPIILSPARAEAGGGLRGEKSPSPKPVKKSHIQRATSFVVLGGERVNKNTPTTASVRYGTKPNYEIFVILVRVPQRKSSTKKKAPSTKRGIILQ